MFFSLVVYHGEIARYHGEIARYHGEIYGNISLNSGNSWGASPPDPPKKMKKCLGGNPPGGPRAQG